MLSSSGEPVPDGPPDIIDVGLSEVWLSEGDSLVVTAFVRHPRGDQALVRGTLLGPGEPTLYGELTRGDNGRWSIAVGWNDVAARLRLNFIDSWDVPMQIRFTDDRGIADERAFKILLRCWPGAPISCVGDCQGTTLPCPG